MTDQIPSALEQDLENMVYLDNSSTTQPAPSVIEAIDDVLHREFGNPSSLHRLGSKAEELVSRSRRSVASLIGAAESDVFFTSGGTEANNWAIIGSVRPKGPCHIISTPVEHPSVMATLSHLEDSGHEVTFVDVDREGRVDPGEVLDAVRPETALVSVMLVQNEIGTIEPIREIGRALFSLGRRRPRFHVDAVQGFARLPIDVDDWGIDLLAASAHKIHGPKGIGALYVRKGLKLEPLIFGGGQESGLRSGTENMPGIAGFGAACDMWETDRGEVMSRMASLRDALVEGIAKAAEEAGADYVPHGPSGADVAPHIVHFSFPGYKGESILHALEKRGVFVSTGSACSAHKAKPSPVVLAIGGGEREALSAIRFSLSRYTTGADITTASRALKESLVELAAWKEKPARTR